MKFTDTKHEKVPFSVHKTIELDYEKWCDDELLDSIRGWCGRENQSSPGEQYFKLDDVRGFVITYEGESGSYWPNEDDNFVDEGLIREFLYSDGICSLDALSIKLYRVDYSVVTISDNEYLLVCPFQSESGNVAGITVVCLTKLLNKKKNKI